MNWISVNNKLPEYNLDVIINYRSICSETDDVNNVTVGFVDVYNDWYRLGDMRQVGEVSHWMPLPEKPK